MTAFAAVAWGIGLLCWFVIADRWACRREADRARAFASSQDPMESHSKLLDDPLPEAELSSQWFSTIANGTYGASFEGRRRKLGQYPPITLERGAIDAAEWITAAITNEANPQSPMVIRSLYEL
jgi:hypothetical protein